jgi:hypothetical protein
MEIRSILMTNKSNLKILMFQNRSSKLKIKTAPVFPVAGAQRNLSEHAANDGPVEAEHYTIP